jgi:AcrR family transcriptional regulator
MKIRRPRKRPYRQGARADATAATGRRIVEAFVECNRDHWFSEVTLESVAQRAGVTVRSIIRRFGGKAGLIDAVVAHMGPKVRAERTAAPGDIDDAMRRLFVFYEEHGDGIVRNLVQEPFHPALKPILNLGRADHRAMLATIFAPWLEPLPAALQQRTHDALDIALGVATWHQLRRDHGRSETEASATIRSMVDGILAEASRLNSPGGTLHEHASKLGSESAGSNRPGRGASRVRSDATDRDQDRVQRSRPRQRRRRAD